jgi:hypothetical protein
MNRPACCALVLCGLACPARAAPVAAELTTRLEWPGSLSVRCGIPIGPGQLLVRAAADPDGSIRFLAGWDGPFARIGPLAAAGLLREAGAPLGFSPGTGVSAEETGLRFDGSLSAAGGLSVQVTMVPRVFALFWLHPESGPGTLGCAVGTGRGRFTMDAVASVSESGLDPPGTEWFTSGAPIAAGQVLHGASRIGVNVPGLAATVSGGVSAAERAPPGWFALCTASAGSGDASLDLLAAGASRGYLGLGGGSAGGGVRAGARLRLAGRLGRIDAQWVMSAGLPGFVPGPFLPSEEKLAFALERRWPAGDGAWEAALDLSNRIETSSAGVTVDDPSGSLSAGWDSTRLQAGVKVDLDRDEGAAAAISVDAKGPGGTGGAGGEARCAWRAREPPSLSFGGHARFVRGSGEVRLRAGIRDVRLAAGGLDGCQPWGSVEWRVSARPP